MFFYKSSEFSGFAGRGQSGGRGQEAKFADFHITIKTALSEPE